MKRGVLGVPEPSSLGAADGITGVESTVHRRTTDAPGVDELTAALNVQEQRTFGGGTDYYVGEALRERTVEDKSYKVEDGQIRERTTVGNVVQDYTRFVVVEAAANGSHSGFVLVSSSSGAFAFGMVARQNTGRIRAADLNLGSFYLDREDTFTPTTSGGPTSSFDAGKLTAWGDDVLEDEDLSSLLNAAVRHDRLNQLAGEYIYEDGSGSGFPYKVNMARSGYVEVWDPNDLTTGQFLTWVRTEVLPYAGFEEDEDDEQSTLPGTDDENDENE